MPAPSSRYNLILSFGGAASIAAGLAALAVTLGAPSAMVPVSGTIAVLAGVAVLFASRAAGENARKSDDAAHLNQAELAREAAAARAAAVTAKEEAEKLTTIQAVLTSEIEQLKRANESQNEQIRQFEEKRSQRSISSQQKFDIRHRLSAMKGSAVEIRLYANEQEARVFADTVRDTLQMAGLEVTIKIMTGKTGTGFALVTHKKENVPPLATAISNAFSECGVKLGVVAEASVPQNTFFIFVGARKQKTA